jgi:splicing factor 3A subunit 1
MSSSEPSRYGVASLDQLDDDDGPSTAAAASSSSAAPASSSSEDAAAAAAPAAPQVESYGVAVGVIEPPPDLKRQCPHTEKEAQRFECAAQRSTGLRSQGTSAMRGADWLCSASLCLSSPVIIDRTADYVRRVGGTFEAEILARNRGKKQFQFLENPASPYAPYYRQRVKYGPEGPPKGAEEQAQLKRAEEEARAAAQAKEEEERRMKEAEAAREAQPKKLSLQERMKAYVDSVHKPNRAKLAEAEAQEAARVQAATNHANSTGTSITPPITSVFAYKLKHPEQYAPVDIDIIKLTALYLARCGMEFLHGLQRREARNVYFDFLKPQHVLFVYFQHLVEAYKAVIVPKRGVKEELRTRVTEGRDAYFQQLLVEAVMQRKKELAELRAKEAEENEKAGVSYIDWKDFVVAATISFLDSEDAYLPVPRETVEEMATMLNAQSLEDQVGKDGPGAGAGAGEEEMDMDVDMETDEAPAAAAAAAPSGPAPAAAASSAQAQQDDEVARLIRSAVLIPGEEVLEVRQNADDDMGVSSRSKAQVFQKCIVCGDEIAIDDLAEHMRIELLDPKWKEQKQALLDRQRESSLTADATVGVNLARMARRNQAAQRGADPMTELKQRKQALQDAILLYGPQSLQAREAAARAGEIVPPPPPAQPAKPAQPAPVQVGVQPRPPQGPQPPQHPQRPGAPPPPPSSAHQPVRPPGSLAAPAPIFSMPAGPAGAPGMPRPPVQGPPGVPGMMYPPGVVPPVPGAAPLPAPPSAASSNPYAAFAPPQPVAPGVGVAAPSPFHSPFMPPPPPAAFPPPPAAMAAAGAGREAPRVEKEDEQPSKRQKTGEESSSAAAGAAAAKGKLLPEAEFLAAHPRTISVRIQVPSDASQPYHFSGQQISLQLQLTDSVQVMKEAIAQQLNGMPANKMKLQFAAGSGGVHINKDDVSLAFYNVLPDSTINLGVKERGGKKKGATGAE